MERRMVDVTEYARSGEKPRSFVLEGQKIVIEEIISQWVEETVVDKQRKRCFRVKGNNGVTFLLSYIEQTGEWYGMIPAQRDT